MSLQGRIFHATKKGMPDTAEVRLPEKSELVADVYDTWKMFVGAGCLTPQYLLSGFVADFRVCQQCSFRYPVRLSGAPWTGAVSSPSSVSFC